MTEKTQKRVHRYLLALTSARLFFDKNCRLCSLFPSGHLEFYHLVTCMDIIFLSLFLLVHFFASRCSALRIYFSTKNNFFKINI